MTAPSRFVKGNSGIFFKFLNKTRRQQGKLTTSFSTTTWN